MVVKTRGDREPFDRTKLERGIVQAVRKRPVSQLQIEEILNDIEDQAMMIAKSTHEIPSRKLGGMVLSRLYEMDSVAYVRFASVYRNFQDAGEFQEFVDEMTERQEREALRRIQEELPF